MTRRGRAGLLRANQKGLSARAPEEGSQAEQGPHVPLRTCVGCRQVEPQAELVRVGWVGPHLVIGRVAGRGAYVHHRQACIDLAVRGGFARSFRRSIPGEEIHNFAKNVAGLDGSNAVETPSRPAGSVAD